MNNNIWKIKQFVYFTKEHIKNNNFQWHYCTLMKCGWENLVCPYGTDTCLNCYYHMEGLLRDKVEVLYE